MLEKVATQREGHGGVEEQRLGERGLSVVIVRRNSLEGMGGC